MAVVEILLSPLPSHVRTARLVVVAAARRAGLGDEHVDELRLAIGEACSRAVGLHAQHAPDRPVQITVVDGGSGLAVEVTDHGPAAGPAVDDVSAGLLDATPDTGDRIFDALTDPDVSLALVTSLVDDVDVAHDAGGTVVTMRWPLPVQSERPGTTAAASS